MGQGVCRWTDPPYPQAGRRVGLDAVVMRYYDKYLP